MWRRVVLLSVMILLAGGGVAAADVAPPAKVLSNFENYWGVSLNRDCGFSQALPNAPGQSVWLFCDTAWTDFNGGHFIGGSTAAVGPYVPGYVPTDLDELPTPPAAPRPHPYYGGPAPFLPTPAGLLNPDGQPCTADGTQYPASWLTGVTAHQGMLLITYGDVCVTRTATPFLVQRFGIAEYDPAANAIRAQTTVISRPGEQLRAAEILGSPIISGGYLYLYGSECTAAAWGVCASGSTYTARVAANAASWRSVNGYRWYTDGGMSRDPADATNVMPAAPLALSVHEFTGHGLNAIVQKDLAGGFEVWRAPGPAGPWTRAGGGKVGCSGGTGLDLCRALTGHPELSTDSQLMISYFNPGSAHVEVAAFPW